jgi:hypothetical protein
VLGHPLDVMAWLADELPRFGLQLRAGDFVTTGVATDVFEAGAGDAWPTSDRSVVSRWRSTDHEPGRPRSWSGLGRRLLVGSTPCT